MTIVEWPPEKTQLLKELYEKNLSYVQIAVQLSITFGHEVTKGAVAGRLDRIKKSGTGAYRKPEIKGPKPLIKHLKDIKQGQCVWPTGDIEYGTLRFCGCKTSLKEPYCELHSTKAFRKAKKPSKTENKWR